MSLRSQVTGDSHLFESLTCEVRIVLLLMTSSYISDVLMRCFKQRTLAKVRKTQETVAAATDALTFMVDKLS